MVILVDKSEREKTIAYLPDDSALEDNQHEEGEQTVIPILVQAPECHTENLENEERSGCLFREQFGERWDRNVELVFAKKVIQCGQTASLKPCWLEESLQGRVT